MTRTVDFQVTGEQTIHCAGCEDRIGKALRRMSGVQDVRASAQTQWVEVIIDPQRVAPDQVQEKLEQMGYQVVPSRA